MADLHKALVNFLADNPRASEFGYGPPVDISDLAKPATPQVAPKTDRLAAPDLTDLAKPAVAPPAGAGLLGRLGAITREQAAAEVTANRQQAETDLAGANSRRETFAPGANVDAMRSHEPEASAANARKRLSKADRQLGTTNPDDYNTPLTPYEEKAFQSWKATYAPNDSGIDYDLRGAFKAGLKPDPKTGHWPDTFKKPNHPTFSNESQYAKERPELAGHWDGDTYVPPSEAQKAGVEPLPQFNKTRDFVDRTIQTFGTTFTQTGKGAARLGGLIPGVSEDNVMVKAADAAEQGIKNAFPGDPARADEFVSQLGQGTGSMLSFMVGGLGTKVVGRAAGLSERLARNIGIAGTGALSQAEQGYEDAAQHEGSKITRYISYFANAGLGATEALPIDRFFGRLNAATGGKVDQIIAHSTAQGLEELIQEVGQQVGQNAVAQVLYDPKRPLAEGAAQQGAIGFILGALMGAGTGMLGHGAHAPQTGPAGPAPLEGEIIPPGAPPPPAPPAGSVERPTIDLTANKPPVVNLPTIPGWPTTENPAATAPTQNRQPLRIELNAGERDRQMGAPPVEVSRGTQPQIAATQRSPTGGDLSDLARPAVNPASASSALPVQNVQPAQITGNSPQKGAEIGDNSSVIALPDLSDIARPIRGAGVRTSPAHATAPSDVSRAEQHVDPEPTPAQVEAGNYKKGHIRWNGLPLSIETAAGGVRRGTGPDGKPWEVTMPVPYGYFKGVTGSDGDQVDAFIGPNPAAPQVFVLDQKDPATGKHDEVKALIGFDTSEAALQAYHGSFSDGSGPGRIAAVSAVSVDDFKRWLRSPHSDKAFHDLAEHPGIVTQSLESGKKSEFQPQDTRPPIEPVDLSDLAKPAAEPAAYDPTTDQNFAPDREALKNFKKGDRVEFTNNPGRPYEKTITGTITKVSDKDQGVFEVATEGGGTWYPRASRLRKALETAPAEEQIPSHEQPNAGIREETPGVPRAEQPGNAREPEGGGPAEPVSQGNRPASGGPVRDGQRPDAEQPGPAEGLSEAGGGARVDPGDGGRTGNEPDRQPAPAAGPAERVDDKERRAQRKLNYRITSDDRIGQGGPKEKVEANLAAIRILKKVEGEHRDATSVEKKALVRYVGWGAFAQDVFAQHKGEWAKQRTELKDLLTADEYAAARASTLNAHYTSEGVIRGVWSAVEQLGYKGGRALEPSAGVGHFIGLSPNKVASATDWSAVELDPVSGGIAKLLYGGADVNVQGFETFTRPDGFYDLAVSNVPFGDYHLRDPKRPSMLIHDYFFAKALDLVRPGGVVAFITSKGTLDKANDSVRKQLAKKADFLGAIRLPGGKGGAFSGNAGTEVTTDIIFLRRKAPGAPEIKGKRDWLDVKQITTPDGPTSINEYFADHPEMMLGEMRLQGTMYRGNEPVLVGDTADIEAKIAAAAKKLPKGAMLPRGNPTRVKDEASVSGDGIKEGSYFEKGGKLYRKVMGVGTPANLSQGDTERVTALMHVRDTVNALLSDQAGRREGTTGVNRVALRAKLNKQYDAFVKKHGAINREDTTVTARLNKAGENVVITKRPNFAKFSADPDAFKVAAIEIYDAEKQQATKAAIFSDDILAAATAPSISSAGDTIGVSLNMFGRLDIPEMARLFGKSQPELIKELGDLIYKNPSSDAWEPAAQYLSGDVLGKLEDAEGAAKSDKTYSRNVEALKKVQPEPLTRDEIRVTLGAPWVPPKIFEQFVRDTVDSDITLSLNPLTKRWLVKHSRMTQTAAAKYGTSRVDPKQVIEAALNMTPLRVTNRDSEGKEWVDEEATREAQIKVAAARDDFAGSIDGAIEGWVWKDDKRVAQLEALYNRTYNRLVPQKFDGSHLTLPGLASTIADSAGQPIPFRLRDHQKNAVARVLQNGNTLMAHVVGAGKTFTMIAAGMEQRRLGQVQRPMYVVPNHMLEQFSREFLQAYPGANILVAQKDEMTRENRKAFGAKVASQKWDGIVITHDAFGRLAMSQDAYVKFAQDEIEEIVRAIEAAHAEDGGKSPTVKDLEKLRKRMEAKLQQLQNKERKDEGVTFEELGVDQLYVDEAHLFKNLQFFTRHTRVKGIGGTASQRSTDLYMKIRFLEKLRPGRSTVFATGTPVSNTMAEMYTMQRYLQLETLKEYGVDSFDGWAGTFGEVVTQMELSPDGRTFRETTAFSKFINIPELVALYSRVSDTQTADMLNLPRPKLKGGKIEVVEADMSPAETSAMDAIVKRAENVRGKRAVKGGDNMLKVVSDGRKVATDLRLMDQQAEFNPHGKIGLAVNSIHDIWKNGKDPAKAQIVFLDMGVPQPKKAVKPAKPEQVSEFLAAVDLGEEEFEGSPDEAEALRSKFDLYNDMRERLIAKGIPKGEVAFIHEATDDSKKAQMFAKVRAGQIRVLIGSTGKMGVGTNVQRKLIAMHHIDAPWKPAEVEQRDGRILRQGNENPEIRIIRYVTKRSMDAFMWQTLERKARFIAQLQAGARGVRHAEDIDSPLPEAADMKAAASGDSRIAEHADLSKRVRDLETAYNSHRRTIEQSKRAAEGMRVKIKGLVQEVAEIGQDVPKVKSTKGDKFALTMKFRGAPQGVFKDRVEAGETIRSFLNEQAGRVWSDRGETMVIGELSGIGLNVTIYRTSTGVEYAIGLKGEYTYASRSRNLIDPEMDPGGLVRRFENGVADIPDMFEARKQELERARTTLAGLERQSDDQGFARLDELKTSKARLAELNKDLRGKDKEKPKPEDDGAEQELSTGAAGEGANDPAQALEIINRVAGQVAVEFKNAIEVRTAGAAEKWGGIDVSDPAGSITRWRGRDGQMRALIEISLNPNFDMENTAYHEAWHAIQRSLGRPNARLLKAEMPRLRKIAAEDFGMSEEDAAKIDENEVLAIAFAAYAQGKGKIHAGLKRYFDAVKSFLRRLGNALRGRGWKTSEDVFGEAYAGEFKGEPADNALFEGSQLSQELSAGKPADPFYSSVVRNVETAKLTKGTPDQWLGYLRNQPGVKQEELAWLGVEDWLKEQSGPVTKEALAAFVRANQVQVKEVAKGGRKLSEEFDDWRAGETTDIGGGETTTPLTLPGVAENGTGINVIHDKDGVVSGYDVFFRGELVGNFDGVVIGFKDAVRILADSMGEEVGGTKFASYQLPGGENYRELLLTLPEKPTAGKQGPAGWAEVGSSRSREGDQNFRSSHWDEPNILAHVRFNEREVNGRRVLFIEEVQSDWHQKGRKTGYQGANAKEAERLKQARDDKEREYQTVRDQWRAATGEQRNALYSKLKGIEAEWTQAIDAWDSANRANAGGVPDAPFKTTWPELAMKRMIRWAAENGFDQVAWTPGSVQAGRYDLSRQIRALYVNRIKSFGETLHYTVLAVENSGREVDLGGKKASELPDAIGKEMAERIVNNEQDKQTYTGLDLKVGGEGMSGFYDRILPAVANKLGKKFGAKVGETRIPQGNADMTDAEKIRLINEHGVSTPEFDRARPKKMLAVHSLQITDAMRDSVMQGQQMFSRGKKRRRPDPNAVWGMPGETERVARFVRALTSARFRRRFGLEAAGKATDTEYRRQTQDREIYWKKARQAQIQTPGQHLEDYDIYQAQTVYRSKAGKKLQDFYEKRMDPLLAFMRAHKITSFDRYLEARTQVETNPRLMQINPALASVLQQQIDDANIFLGFIQGGAKAGAYAHAGRMFDDMRRETLDLLLHSGLIDQATHAAWGRQQHYAPLRGFEEDPEAAAEYARTGRGFDVHGPEAKMRLGRESRADSPLAYMFQQAAQAIIRADKNAVDQRAYGAILRYPNREIWEADPVGFTRVFDRAIGQVVIKQLNPQATQRANEDNVFGVKFHGKQFFFAVYHKGLSEGLRTPGGSNMIVRFLDAIGRWRRSNITGLSPEFWENNFERDLQEGLINVSAVKAPWLRTRIIKDLPAAIAGLAGKGPLTQWREEFEADGGRVIGYGVDTIQHYKDKIDDAMARGVGRNVRHGLREVLHFIEVVNGWFENGVRLSVYKNLRQSGTSREKAAAYAKEITINFDRRGEMGQAINAYKFFYNPRIQGTVRTIQALKSPRVRRIVYGMLLAGLLNEWMNYWAAGDDPTDKMNKWDKKPYTQKVGRMHFGWIPIGSGTLALPSSYGPGFFFMLGQDLGAYMRHLAGMGKGADAPETLAHIYGNLMNAMSPFDFTTGHSLPSFFTHLIWPSSVPGVDVVTNERWNGGYVTPPDYPATTPFSQQTSAADDPALVWTAQELNWLTGGDPYESGAVDLAPGWLQSGIDYATGGLGHFVQKVKNFSGEIASGEWPNARDIPFNNVYFPNDERANQQVYYDLRARVDIVKNRLHHAGSPDEREAAKAANPVEAAVVSKFRMVEATIAALRKQRSATTDQAKVDAINEKIAVQMAKARLAWEMAREKQAQ